MTDYDRTQFTSFVSPEDYLKQDISAFSAMHNTQQSTGLLDSLDSIFQATPTASDTATPNIRSPSPLPGGNSGRVSPVAGQRAPSPVLNPLLEAASTGAAAGTAGGSTISTSHSMRPSIPQPAGSPIQTQPVLRPQPTTRSSSIKPFSSGSTETVIQPVPSSPSPSLGSMPAPRSPAAALFNVINDDSATTNNNGYSTSSSTSTLDREDEALYSEIKAVGGGEKHGSSQAVSGHPLTRTSSNGTGGSGTAVRRPSGARRPSDGANAEALANATKFKSAVSSIGQAVTNPLHDSKYKFMTPEQIEQANEIAKLGAKHARVLSKEGWEQTKSAAGYVGL
jgi:hypothetical protein